MAPSLSRRRGTKARSSSSSSSMLMSPVVRHCMMLVGIVVVLFLTLVGSLFGQLTAVEKQTPVDSLRHKVIALPNQLRGRKFPSLTTTKTVAVPPPPPQQQQAAAEQQQQQQQQQQRRDTAAAGPGGIADSNYGSGKPEYPYPLHAVSPDYDIATQFKVLGGHRYEEYTTGDAPYHISAQIREQSNVVARSRRVFIKKAMQHAWKGYEELAFGFDELLPQTGQGSNGWGGQGITLVDSLDTLWLMGLKDEFWRGRDWVRDHLDHSQTGKVSVFETTIRDLGGLLSAYDFSGDQAFLTKAIDLGTRLLKAFDGSETGIPFGQVSLRDGSAANIPWAAGNALVAEFGTLQIENRYLSKRSGQPQFARLTERAMEILHEISPETGLFPIYVKNSFRGQAEKLPKLNDGIHTRPMFANQKITFGAMGDSLYEYLLKIWLQGGKTETMYRDMYDKAIQSMHDKLLQRSNPSGLAYIADLTDGVSRLDHKMDHLVCFMGGSLALGAYTDPLGLDSARAQRDLKTARALTYTCYQMYARMNTGISAEFVQFQNGVDFVIGRGAPHYLLRPEAFESFFILNHLTGDPVYREWGWECFQAIEKYCKTRHAYGELSNVADVNGIPRNKMESFFLAETLKYLYLLQDPETEIDLLHKHVFNTEAHPMRIFPVIDQEEKQPPAPNTQS